MGGEGWWGRGDEQVWKGEAKYMWTGAMTRFIQAIIMSGADLPGEKSEV